MQVEPQLTPGIILSDLVIREGGSNKLSLIGCFQRFHFPKFPAQTGRWFATVGVTGIRDANKFNVTGRIEVGESAHVVSSTNALVEFKSKSDQTIRPEMIFEVPLPFNRVVFQDAGQYVVVVLVDTEEVGRRTLAVAPITQSVGGE